LSKLFIPIILLLIVRFYCRKENSQTTLKEFLLRNWNYKKLVTSAYRKNGVPIEELITQINSDDYGCGFFPTRHALTDFGGDQKIYLENCI
jgi:hypothetical protein